MKRAQVDFNYVEPHQVALHLRLENWARWCNGTGASGVAPMFRQYRSAEHWDQHDASVPIDTLDAAKVSSAVSKLPQKHALSIGWCYVQQGSPRSACSRIGVTMAGLYELIRDARQMLINRKC